METFEYARAAWKKYVQKVDLIKNYSEYCKQISYPIIRPQVQDLIQAYKSSSSRSKFFFQLWSSGTYQQYAFLYFQIQSFDFYRLDYQISDLNNQVFNFPQFLYHLQRQSPKWQVDKKRQYAEIKSLIFPQGKSIQDCAKWCKQRKFWKQNHLDLFYLSYQKQKLQIQLQSMIKTKKVLEKVQMQQEAAFQRHPPVLRVQCINKSIKFIKNKLIQISNDSIIKVQNKYNKILRQISQVYINVDLDQIDQDVEKQLNQYYPFIINIDYFLKKEENKKIMKRIKQENLKRIT